MNISLIIPTRNNLKYVCSAYSSIRRYNGPEPEIIILDDASTDRTWDWLSTVQKSDPNLQIYKNSGPNRVGHTVLYDIGVNMAKNDLFGVFHADMISSPQYLFNMMKCVGPGKVISATRIEPPLHPGGIEKIIHNFGFEPEEFNEKEYLDFIKNKEVEFSGVTTKGIFAPWVMYKEDFLKIGGHDKRLFAPMELEDSDLFNRFVLAGYEVIQARDAFVYHMTCRGSRFKDGLKIEKEIPLQDGSVWFKPKDSDEYTALRNLKFREWWRKWHSDVLHDTLMCPIVYKRYNVGFRLLCHNKDILKFLEPWCDTLYVNDPTSEVVLSYISEEEKISAFNINNKFKRLSDTNIDAAVSLNDIVVEFDPTKINQERFDFIKNLSKIIETSGEVGLMEHDIFKIHIYSLKSKESLLINNNDFYRNFNLK